MPAHALKPVSGTASTSTRGTDAVDRRIGNRIKDRRLAIDMTQAGLGEAVGVTFQQVQKYERGVNRVSAARLQRIANVLGVPLRYFINEEGAELDGAGKPDHALGLDATGRRLAEAWPRLSEEVRTALLTLAVASLD